MAKPYQLIPNFHSLHRSSIALREIIGRIISEMHVLFQQYPESGFKNYHHLFESHNLLKDKLCKVELDKGTIAQHQSALDLIWRVQRRIVAAHQHFLLKTPKAQRQRAGELH